MGTRKNNRKDRSQKKNRDSGDSGDKLFLTANCKILCSARANVTLKLFFVARMRNSGIRE